MTLKMRDDGIVQHLQWNLENYRPDTSGYTILKEMLQNADDARACSVAIAFGEGWQQSGHPLLRGKGVLIVNDGDFSPVARNGMQTFGGSAKISDTSQVGRFGLGQKSLFHICDAFFCVTSGHGADDDHFMVNPWEAVAEEGMPSAAWRNFAADDAARIDAMAKEVMPVSRRLSLWIPLRHERIRPVEGSCGIHEHDPDPAELRMGLSDPLRLATCLATLRYVRNVGIGRSGAETALKRGGETALSADPAQERAIGGISEGVLIRGRERKSRDPLFTDIRSRASWPVVRDRLGRFLPDKAEPHGAVVVVHLPAHGDLVDLAWSAFLPVGEAMPLAPPAGSGTTRLVLHGFFFVDSGRKHILFEPRENADGKERTLCEWNAALRDRVILPMLPRALADAAENLANAEMARVVNALRSSEFFRRHAAAICAEHSLIEHEGENGRWRAVPAETPLRPMPVGFEAADLRSLAGMEEDDETRLLCSGAPRLLSTERPLWPEDELCAIVRRQAATLFQSTQKARLTAALIDVGVAQEALGAALHAALRDALNEAPALAASREVGALVTRITAGRILVLPNDTPRLVLRTLAEAKASVFAMPRDRVGEYHEATKPFIDEEDAVRLLEALEPLCVSGDEGALRAVNQILKLAKPSPARLARQSRLRHRKLLRLASGEPVSLQELAAAGAGRRLFRNDITARKLTEDLRAAIDRTDLILVSEELAGILDRNEDGTAMNGIGAFRPDPNGIAEFVLTAKPGFRGAQARSALVGRLLEDAGSARVTKAAKCVAVGDSSLPDSALLFRLPEGADALEGFFVRTLAASAGLRLVPMAALEETKPHGIRRLQCDEIASLATPLARALAGAHLDDAEYSDFCRLPLDDDWLKSQAVHPFTDRTYGVINETTVLHSDHASVPETLRPLIRVLRRAERDAATFQARVVPRWSATRSLALALGADAPHHHWMAILDSLGPAGLEASMDRARLKKTAWLPLADGTGAASPEEVLDLPRTAMEEARHLLPERLLPLRSDLGSSLFDHSASALLERLFNTRAFSISLLADLIRQEGSIAGQQGTGSCDAEMLADLTTLSRAKADRPVTGWPLLAALLADWNGDDRETEKALTELLRAFSVTPDAMHGKDMNSLARLAQAGGRVGEAARRLHRRWWDRAARWDDLPVDLELPAANGDWRAASALTRANVLGVAIRHRLHDDYDRVLCGAGGQTRGAIQQDGEAFGNTKPSEIAEKSRRTLETVFRDWAGAVPADLILIALRLAGGDETFAALAETHSRRSSAGGWQALWARLESHLGDTERAGVQGDPTFGESVRRRILYARRGAANAVPARTLDGRWRDLPAGDDAGLLRGERHRQALTPRGGVDFRLAELAPGAPPADLDQARQALLHFICEIGEHLHGLSGERLKALRTFAESHAEPTQTTLRHVETQIIDRLPTILDQLKPFPGSRLAKARDDYRQEERQYIEHPGRLRDAKTKLWEILGGDKAVHGELLAIIRAAVGRDGYDGRSVLFELFQNAEDAYRQSGAEAPAHPSFRVESEPGVLRAWHEGRRINDRGPDRAIARERGYEHDFFNMLVRGLSEKQPQDGVTGRFGLGFKSVHLLANEVRIASGTLAARITGALILSGWTDPPAEWRPLSTLIDLQIDPDRDQQREDALKAFSTALPWLLTTARQICDVRTPDRHWRRDRYVVLADGIEWLAIGDRKALRLDLGDGFRMIVALDNGAPKPIDLQSRGLWSLAPLKDQIGGGWIIDGPWQVDPGRNHVRDPAGVLVRLGVVLEDRLLALVDLLSSQAAEIVLEGASTPDGRDRFVDRLHAIFVEHRGSESLVAEGRGWMGVARKRSVVPTRLSAPFERPVQASEELKVAEGILLDERWLRAVADWPSAADLTGWLVSKRTANDLAELGLHRLATLTLNDLVLLELKRLGRKVGFADAMRIGMVLKTISEADRQLLPKEPELPETLKTAKMPNRVGEYRLPGELLLPGECLFDRIVPDEWRLADGFAADSDARFFFDRCRDRTGFNPNEPHRLGRWLDAVSPEAGAALLRQLMGEDRLKEVKPVLGAAWPRWLPRDPARLRALLAAQRWQFEEVESAVYEFYGMGNVLERQSVPTSGEEEDADEPELDDWLADLSRWWSACHLEERRKADARAYPDGFYPPALPHHGDGLDAAGRSRWFTMLALARLKSMGRARDEQHRTFIATALNEGWWHELAQPPETNEAQWVTRLRAWSDPRIVDPLYEHWGSAFVDLYRLSRWLPEYVEMLLRVPRILTAHGTSVDFDLILRPERSLAWQRMGLDAASLHRPLRSGICWLLRELLRHGLFEAANGPALAPFLWQPTGRLCRRLEAGGIILHEDGPERSLEIHRALSARLGVTDALFLGDHDLPLQIALDGTANAGWMDWRARHGAAASDDEAGDDSAWDEDDGVRGTA